MKRTAFPALVLTLVIILTSCTGNSQNDLSAITFTADEAVNYLIGEIKTESVLEIQKEAFIKTVMGSCTYTHAAAAASTGIAPDMLAVVEAADSAEARLIYEEMEKYASDMKDEYSKYAPEEVEKIGSAVISSHGCWVIMCICADNQAAAKLIDEMWANDISVPATTQVAVSTTAKATEPSVATVTDFESIGNIFRAGNACYECYYYNSNYADEYASSVNSFVSRLPSGVTVYDMLIPLSSAITLPDNLTGEINSGNQKAAISNVTSKLSESIKSVGLYNALRQHRDEYIYFRTDHHWTALGAYYAYVQFCKTKNVKATPLKQYSSVNFEGFLGTFYNDSGKSSKLKADTVTAYYPINNDSITLKYTDTKGNVYDWPIIGNVSSYDASLKYSTFAAADNPYTVIKNSALTDGSVCVVIKESFGNALVPFLSDLYQTVYEIDYRYYTGDVYSLISSNKSCDVILVNNLSMLQSKYLQGKLMSLLSA